MENLVELGSSPNEGGDLEEGPSGERWPPLGAAAVEEEQMCCQDYDFQFSHESERLRDLEEQQELLNSSLIALTTHFAQVQFRLRQIIDSPAQDREALLQDLEEFAFKGIPDIPDSGYQLVLHQDSKEFETAIAAQRMKQKELIGQLKIQLEELENYAYEMGEAGLPQNVIMEKQKVIIDELKGKLNLNVDDIDRLTLEDIRHQVDSAISELVNPLKMKEQLVIQLKTQIVDLERFIDFLQGDEDAWNSPEAKKYLKGRTCKCTCPVHSSPKEGKKLTKNETTWKREPPVNNTSDEIKDKTINMIRRVAALLQIFAVSQFGCGSSVIRFNSMKKSMKVQHWGDLRARLELAVVNVLTLAADQEAQESYEYSSDSENYGVDSNAKMTTAVRKQLAISIRDLMQHGLVPVNFNNIRENYDTSNPVVAEILKVKEQRLRILQEINKQQKEEFPDLNLPLEDNYKSKHNGTHVNKRRSEPKPKTSLSQNSPLVTRRSARLQNSPSVSYKEDSIVYKEEISKTPFVRPPNDYGPIPGVEVGHHWERRMECSQYGVHRPTVAGIHGGPDGVYSIALSGGYPEDVDEGDSFIYTGAGGRDLKGTSTKPKNLRIAPKTKDQQLEGTNLSLVDEGNTLVPFMGCFASKGKEISTMHAWELILRYYDIKNGARFNSTPVRKLSQSFNLNIVGSKAISNKQNMLGAIGNIISLHTQFKRSYDAQFKAFVCAGLNSKKLVVWLRLIFRCQPLIETYYKPWSYVAKTGFEDSLQSLDKLTNIKFDLPVDIAVHQFQNIKDAF